MHPESTPTWLIGPEVAPSQRIGTVLSGSYRLDAFLGQGMTGVTYNAWHLRQKQPYAVKLLHRELAPSHERVAKLVARGKKKSIQFVNRSQSSDLFIREGHYGALRRIEESETYLPTIVPT